MSEVRYQSGVPTADSFAGLGAPTQCAPIVVDTDTGLAYTLKTGDTVVQLTEAAGTGDTAPATTPVYVGQFFVDTTGKKVYCATGTASSSDWTVLN